MSILSVEEQINRLKTSLEIDKAAGAKVIIDNRLLNIVGVMSDLQDSLHETQVKLEKLSIKVTGIEMKTGIISGSSEASVYFDEDDRTPYFDIGIEYDVFNWRISIFETGSQVIFALDSLGKVMSLGQEVLVYSKSIKDSPVTMKVIGITPSTKVYGIPLDSECTGRFFYTLETCKE